MDYGNILSRAWKITWNNKILWLFGILTALGSGGGGGGGGGNGGNRPGGGPGDFPFAEQFQRFFDRPEAIAVVIAVVIVLLLVGLALFVLSIIGRGGLIGGIRLADDGGKVMFGEAWGYGTRRFWRMLGIQLLLAAAGIVIGFFGLLTGLAGAATFGIGLICLLPILCLLILALIPLSILAHFAQFAVVLDDLGVMDAFRKGWQVLKANVGSIIVLGLILLVAGFVAGLILAAPFIAIVVPAALAFAIGGREPNLPLLVGAGLAFVCYLPIAIVLSGILQTWLMSAWTLAYRQFTGGAPALAPTAIPAA